MGFQVSDSQTGQAGVAAQWTRISGSGTIQ
jgi:hypothetical protein